MDPPNCGRAGDSNSSALVETELVPGSPEDAGPAVAEVETRAAVDPPNCGRAGGSNSGATVDAEVVLGSPEIAGAAVAKEVPSHEPGQLGEAAPWSAAPHFEHSCLYLH